MGYIETVRKEIPLSRGLVTIVDEADYEQLSQWKWHASKTRHDVSYAVRNNPDIPGSLILMHVEILKPEVGLETDHINGDGLDNRRENLRAVTHTQNMLNRKSVSGSTSIYKGVSWHNGSKKWRAVGPTVSSEKKHIGMFDREIEAALAHDRSIIEAGSDFARLNFPDVIATSYIENPKTAGSGIICAIPQKGKCPVNCADCYYQSGRSFLEPLSENLPNVPPPPQPDKIVRFNDGNDSNVQRELVERYAKLYRNSFFNTSMPKKLGEFKRPVVLTVNPSKMTDDRAHLVDPCPQNLMFVRVRTNAWNLKLVDSVVEHYSARKVPIVLTLMAYYGESIPEGHENSYTFRKRTLNSYWVITPEAWDGIVDRYRGNFLVYPCGKDANTFGCKHCGNCLREYFSTVSRCGQNTNCQI